jgi:predicted CXXCH cytochrome family protein
MSSTHHHSAIRARLCPAILTALLIVALPASALAAAPTTPALTDAYVDGAGYVTVEWNASTDADGDPVTYTVYRLQQPITATNIGSATAVASSVSGTSATVSAHADEIAQSYVWFYAVRATDGTNLSLVSKTMAPNLHGYRLSSATVSCTRCHEVHGAYPADWDYTYVDLCYSCHGATSAADAAGAKSSLNIQAEFGDYDGQTQPASVHRSTKMETDRTECDACHSAHRSPYYYDNSGNYVAASSYRKMIRVQTGEDAGGPLYTYYSYNDDTLNPESGENAAFCLACHGSDATPIGYVGDVDDYAGTGGDHNSAGYSAAAHGPSVVYSNDHGRTNASEYPQVQCLACHAKHASAADKLIAYRGDDAGSYAESGLCFACHSSASGESRVAAGYSAPFSWNDRDVESEFSRTSAHPVSSSATGRSLTCASCHNVHNVTEAGTGAWSLARVSTPSNTKATPADMTAFCLGCHTTTPPSATIAADTLVPYRIGFSDQSAAPYFPGWDKSGFGTLGVGETNHYTPATGGQPALCKNCHDPHGSDYERLVAWSAPTGAEKVGAWTPNSGTRENDSATASALSSEENLCYQCHGNGVAYPKAPGAANVYTPANPASGSNNTHVMSDYSGRHSDTEVAADLGGTNRHSECVDCHDPHAAKRVGGTATQDTLDTSAPGGAIHGVWGVVPDYSNPVRDGTSNPGTYNWTTPSTFTDLRLTGVTTDMEAYLCFKCHSGNTAQPAGQGDTALEFNPSNFSVHNVLGQSVGAQEQFTYVASDANTYTDTWQFPTIGVFQASYDQNTMLTCTSCHTNESGNAKGPHGSTVQWLLDPAYPTDWKTSYLVVSTDDPDGMYGTPICQKCHSLYGAGGVVSNSAHGRVSRHGGSSNPCISCHIKIPHGWKRPRLLGHQSDDPAYAATELNEIRANTSHTRDANGSVGWSSGDCSTDYLGASGCGGSTHSDIAVSW